MQWLKVPQKIYFKKGCMPVALDELGTVFDKKNAFIVTNNATYPMQVITDIQDKLDFMGIKHTCFYNIGNTPALEDLAVGKKEITLFASDVIIAVGGGCVIDFAKMLWLVYEHPDCDIQKLAEIFCDISLKDELFPTLGNKADFVAIPVLSSTGSEVSPLAVIGDADSKITLVDYQLLPTMAIIDADNFVGMKPVSGVAALTHALKACISENASDYTDGFAIESIRNILNFMGSACDVDRHDSKATEKIADAFVMSGIAYGNAYDTSDESAVLSILQKEAYQNPALMEKCCDCAKFCGISGKDDTEIFDRFVLKISRYLQNLILSDC